jgi:hypothetical protein
VTAPSLEHAKTDLAAWEAYRAVAQAEISPDDGKRLVCVPPDVLLAWAQMATITNHETGAKSKWLPNSEQWTMAQAFWHHPWTMVLKVRQIGASTLCCFFDAVFAACNDAAGNKVNVAILVDSDAKARERLRICADFLDQLGIQYMSDKQQGCLTLRGGSVIWAMTAGGKRAGASMTFQLLHMTEVPFWRDQKATYTSIMQALVAQGRCIVETTTGNDNSLLLSLWNNDHRYHKIFFPFEEHLEYRSPVRRTGRAALTEEMEDKLRAEGFTIPEAMQDWIDRLWGRCGGEWDKCMREYPQKPEHAFSFSGGRVIPYTPTEYPHALAQVEELPEYRAMVFHQARQGAAYMLSIDTSQGLGASRSTIAVIDRETRQLVASFGNETISSKDLAVVARFLADKYHTMVLRRHGRHAGRMMDCYPVVVVEKNGIGGATLQECHVQGLNTVAFEATKASVKAGLESVSEAVKSGILGGGPDLIHEITNLHKSPTGRFVGEKDLVMAIANAYTWIEANPWGGV